MVASLIARIRAEQERVRVLMSDTLTYRERIRELEAEVAAADQKFCQCMNCDFVISYSRRNEAERQAAFQAVNDHAANCPEDPLRAEVAKLREALEDSCGILDGLRFDDINSEGAITAQYKANRSALGESKA